jgi:hypothetical protein
MKTIRVLYKSSLQTELTEGERLECKIERMTENSEPIGETAPLIYTPRKDGVIAAYDIRTDKWDIALDAMSKVNKTRGQIVNLGGMNEAKKAVADGTIEAQELN